VKWNKTNILFLFHNEIISCCINYRNNTGREGAGKEVGREAERQAGKERGLWRQGVRARAIARERHRCFICVLIKSRD